MAYYGSYGTGVNDAGSGVRYLGIWYRITDNGSTVSVNAEIWYKDTSGTMSDSSNTMYFDVGATAATTSKGSYTVNITKVETLIATYTVGTYTKGATAKTYNCAAKWVGLGSSNTTISVTNSFTVPAMDAYSINFDVNYEGGIDNPEPLEKIQDQGRRLHVTPPIRKGYTFYGWNTASDESGTMYYTGDLYTANASTTLYAIWTRNVYHDILIYKNDLSCEAVRFIEDDTLEFDRYGQVIANEFIESSDGVLINNAMQFGELIER